MAFAVPIFSESFALDMVYKKIVIIFKTLDWHWRLDWGLLPSWCSAWFSTGIRSSWKYYGQISFNEICRKIFSWNCSWILLERSLGWRIYLRICWFQGWIIFRYLFTSMTSLLTHTVAHSTRPFYRPKINHQPLKKFLSLAVSWVKVVKKGKILTFKVNFLCKKSYKSF